MTIAIEEKKNSEEEKMGNILSRLICFCPNPFHSVHFFKRRKTKLRSHKNVTPTWFKIKLFFFNLYMTDLKPLRNGWKLNKFFVMTPSFEIWIIQFSFGMKWEWKLDQQWTINQKFSLYWLFFLIIFLLKSTLLEKKNCLTVFQL